MSECCCPESHSDMLLHIYVSSSHILTVNRADILWKWSDIFLNSSTTKLNKKQSCTWIRSREGFSFLCAGLRPGEDFSPALALVLLLEHLLFHFHNENLSQRRIWVRRGFVVETESTTYVAFLFLWCWCFRWNVWLTAGQLLWQSCSAFQS